MFDIATNLVECANFRSDILWLQRQNAAITWLVLLVAERGCTGVNLKEKFIFWRWTEFAWFTLRQWDSKMKSFACSFAIKIYVDWRARIEIVKRTLSSLPLAAKNVLFRKWSRLVFEGKPTSTATHWNVRCNVTCSSNMENGIGWVPAHPSVNTSISRLCNFSLVKPLLSRGSVCYRSSTSLQHRLK